MKLHFRGRDYDGPHTEWEMSEGEVAGVYRGSPWRVHRPKKEHRRRQRNAECIYRGVRYTKK